jgi:hypothetical protein
MKKTSIYSLLLILTLSACQGKQRVVVKDEPGSDSSALHPEDGTVTEEEIDSLIKK